MNWEFKCLQVHCTSESIDQKCQLYVLSNEKMNKGLCLNSYVIFAMNNTSLEITKYTLSDERFPLYLKTFFQLIVQILVFCKDIMLNLDCSAISINFAAWAVNSYLNLFSAVICCYRFQIAYILVASLWTNKTMTRLR